jgi:hypothetical protein
MYRQFYKPKVTQYQLDAESVYHLSAEGLGDASICALLGVGIQTFRDALANDPELMEVYEMGQMLVTEQIESKILQIIDSPSASNRDKINAYSTWGKHNKFLTKRTIKARHEAFRELTTPDLYRELDQLLAQTEEATLTDRMQALELDQLP